VSALPGARVLTSSDVLPEMREYERFSTTVASAYLAPSLARYLDSLGEALAREELPAPTIVQSSGGSTDIDGAIERAAACVLSGPAGGVVGAAFVASASGYEDVLTFDMGGTSTDVAPIVGGRVQVTTESALGGIPIRLPAVDVHSVSAGGGSIAWADEGGALRVGPQSAGAIPGPAGYGRGGEAATVTDANLLLGYLPDGAVLGGEVQLDRRRSERALSALGAQLGLTAIQTAAGVVDVANAEMTRALRVISVERGLDPRDFALVAFGGAGPLHACALAEELGVARVLVPKAAGVLSALGLAVADHRRDYVAPFKRGELDFSDLEKRARSELPGAVHERLVDARYRGQSFELTVSADGFRDEFHRAHERRFGFRVESAPVEIVHLRLISTRSVEAPALVEVEAPEADAACGHRRLFLDGEWIAVPVYERPRMGCGSSLDGPAVVEFSEATCLVTSGWSGEIDEAGTLVLCPR
jgi:N-methylhydantoinase A